MELRTAELAAWIEARRLRPRLDPKRFDLEEMAEAHAKCESHHSEGRIVILIGDES